MFDLNKLHSRLRKFLNKNGIPQQDVVRESNVNKGTIIRIYQEDAFQPLLIQWK